MPEITDEQRKQLEEKIKNMSPEELKQFQKQQCVFCQIVAGKIPSKKVYEDDKCIAVLDINPAAKGHLLIMPKEHYTIMPQIPEKEMAHLFLVSKHLSQIILKTLKVSGTNIFVANGPAAGQRAQHFMLHLIPRKEGDKLMDNPDKLIDANLRAKVKELIEPRLNALLGVKKEVQQTLPSAPEPSTEPIKEDKQVEEAEWKEVEEEKEASQKPAKKSSKSKSKTAKEPKASAGKKSKKSVDKAPEPATEDDNDNASLDDIANLFR